MPQYQIVVSDASVILDLAKTRLIEATLALPFEFVIPDVILNEELIDLGSYTATDLIRLGFKIGTLDGTGAAAAMAHYAGNALKVSINDCFALAYAQQHKCILMTGDGPLRSLAERLNLEVHGFLWAASEIADRKTFPLDRLVAALKQLQQDSSARLPQDALADLINRFTPSV